MSDHLDPLEKLSTDTPRTKSKSVRFSTLCSEEGQYWVPHQLSAKLERELNAANERIKRLEEALRRIVDQDFRGNRSTESQVAFEALKEAKP